MYRDLGFIRVWGKGSSDGVEYAYLVYPHKPIVAYLPQTGVLLNEYCVEFPDETRPYGSSRLPDSDDVLATIAPSFSMIPVFARLNALSADSEAAGEWASLDLINYLRSQAELAARLEAARNALELSRIARDVGEDARRGGLEERRDTERPRPAPAAPRR